MRSLNKGSKGFYSNLSTEAKAALWFTFCSALSRGINFLVMPFLTRIMPAEQYAYITVYNSWIAILLTVIALTLYGAIINTAMMKYENNRPQLLSSGFGLLAVLCLVAFIFFAFFSEQLSYLLNLNRFLVIAIPLNILVTSEFSFWAAYQRFEYRYIKLAILTSVYIILPAIISVIATAFWPDESTKAVVKVWVQIGINLPIIVGIGIKVIRRGGVPFNKSIWKYLLVYGVSLIPHYLSMMMLGQLDRVMIAGMCGPIDAAVYGVAYQVSLATGIITSAISSALVPWAFSILKQGSCSHSDTVTMNTVVLMVAIANMLLVLIAPELIALAAPVEYQGASNLIPVIAASSYFSFLYALFIDIELFYEHKSYTVIISCGAAIANAALNYFLLPYFGYPVAAFTTLFCYMLMGASHSFITKKILKSKKITLYDFKTIWIIGICLVVINQGLVFIYGQPFIRIIVILIVAILLFRYRNTLRSTITKTRKGKKSDDSI